MNSEFKMHLQMVSSNDELARILRNTADRVDSLDKRPLKILDANGNTVGVAAVCQTQQELDDFDYLVSEIEG